MSGKFQYMKGEVNGAKTINVIQCPRLQEKVCARLEIPEEEYSSYLSKISDVVRIHLIEGEAFYIPTVGVLVPYETLNGRIGVRFELRDGMKETLKSLALWGQGHEESQQLNDIVWLTPKEVAEYLRVGESTLLEWLRKGKIPGTKIAGTWRIDQAKLEHFLQDQHNQTEYQEEEI